MLIVIVILIIITILPIISYKKETNTNPLPPLYKKGVYHMHSIYSDGLGTINDITKAASNTDLDFAILTDHGRPNQKASTATSYTNGVLLIGGSEFSLHSGHLACIGYKTPNYIFPPEPQETINEINTHNAISFISHPFDTKIPWTNWNIHGYTGIEVLSCYSSARKISYLKLAAFPLQYLINSNYALTSTLKYPHENINKWNSLNMQKGTVGLYGIYALDAHAKLPISENHHLNFPSYQSMFEILRIYVKINNPLNKKNARKDAKTIISALRKGNFFNVIESIAPANGFQAQFIENSGNTVEMGNLSTKTKGKLNIHLPFDFDTDVIVKRNGNTFERITNNHEKKQVIDINEPGFYVIEVYAGNHKFNNLPWIMTNPFFVGTKNIPASPTPTTEKKEIEVNQSLAVEKGFFHVETNPGSEGVLSYEEPETSELITSLTFKLSKDSQSGRDFWSALSVRKRFDFSGSKGICFHARSHRKRRFWVEFRTGKKGKENWYRHSFLAEAEWKRFVIPFERFHMIFGEGKTADLADISSFFFSINNAAAYEGTSGVLDLKNINLYR